MLYFDLETCLIDRGALDPPPVCGAFAVDGGEVVLLEATEFVPVLGRALQDGQHVAGHNVAFDLGCLLRWHPELTQSIWDAARDLRVHCTMVRQKILDFATDGRAHKKGYSLATTAGRYGLVEPDKGSTWRLEYGRLLGLPISAYPAGAVKYSKGDILATRAVFEAQEQVGKAFEREWKAPCLHLSGLEGGKALALHMISCKGVYTDPVRTERLAAEVRDLLEGCKIDLQHVGLVRLNGTRNTQAATTRLKAAYVGRAVPLTAKGAVSLDKDACAGSGDPFLEQYSTYGQAGTLMARVEDLRQGYTLPLQTRFDTLLETSRTSTSKPAPPLVGIQAQNFPRKIGVRECLRPSAADRVFVIVDLPTAELRSLGQTCLEWFGASTMADLINGGVDLHTWFAAKVLRIPYELAQAEVKTDRMQTARGNAKPCNFGFPGGMGALSFREFAWLSYKVRLSEQEATDLRNEWLHAFPEMPHFFGRVSSMMGSGAVRHTEDGRTHETATIRHPVTGRWRANTAYCAACNSHFQERTATGAALGLQETQRRCFSERGSALYGSWAVMYTHDEIVLDSPRAVAHDAAMELGQIAADRFNILHPDVPIKTIDPCVAGIYSKKARAVFGPDGRLVPWAPTE